MNYKKILLIVFVLSFLLTYNNLSVNKTKNTINNISRQKSLNVDKPRNSRDSLKIVEKNRKISYRLASKSKFSFIMTNTQMSVKEILNIDLPYSTLELYFLSNKELDNYRLIIEGKLIDESIEQVIIENIPNLNVKPVQVNLKFKDTLRYIDFIIKELKSRDLNCTELENITLEIKNVQSSIRVLRDYVDTEEVKYFLFSKLEKEKNRYINILSEFIENN